MSEPFQPSTPPSSRSPATPRRSLAKQLAALPPDLQRQALADATADELSALAEDHAADVRDSFHAWCIEALAVRNQTPAAHHVLLIKELQALADGENDRLIVMMPPGSAKTTYVSRLLPPWYLSRKPNLAVLLASHTATLAEYNSLQAQNYVPEHTTLLGYAVKRGTSELWETTNGGAVRAAGVNAGIAGFRADLCVIDDPLKSREDADNQNVREKQWKWWTDDVEPRLKPGGAVALVTTRWHVDDLAGRLVKASKEGGKPWRVIRLPMEAGHDDPLGREPGELLWPEWFTPDMVAQAKRTKRTWASLYQQVPFIEGGQIILEETWRPWSDTLPVPTYVILSVDGAYTKDEQNDPSACAVMWVIEDPIDHRSALLLRYAWAMKLEFPELCDEIVATWEDKRLVPPGVSCRVLVENKASGISVVQELRRRIDKIPVWAAKVKGDKVARAYSCQPAFEAGKIYAMALPPTSPGAAPVFRPWADAVISEMASFPAGEHDDLTDTVTQAIRHVRDMGIQLMAEDDPPPPGVQKDGQPKRLLTTGKKRGLYLPPIRRG